ncbi:hypothetical protein A3A42_00355 [Candidatus Kaiserbacteria bacterium RIFCSPLOWO2_01_FULL_55_25]|nr:MAG: hypothetical protein A3A42_00355 [Candidatus Kaiserbacteria bacterium RIFCSPLOWO2_01_FULL_55_25]
MTFKLEKSFIVRGSIWEGEMPDIITKLDFNAVHSALTDAWRHGARYGNAYTLPALESALSHQCKILGQPLERLLVVGTRAVAGMYEECAAELRAYAPGVVLCLLLNSIERDSCSGLLVRSDGSWMYEVKAFGVGPDGRKGNAYFRQEPLGARENVVAVFDWGYPRGESDCVEIDAYRWVRTREFVERWLGPKT